MLARPLAAPSAADSATPALWAVCVAGHQKKAPQDQQQRHGVATIVLQRGGHGGRERPPSRYLVYVVMVPVY